MQSKGGRRRRVRSDGMTLGQTAYQCWLKGESEGVGWGLLEEPEQARWESVAASVVRLNGQRKRMIPHPQPITNYHQYLYLRTHICTPHPHTAQLMHSDPTVMQILHSKTKKTIMRNEETKRRCAGPRSSEAQRRKGEAKKRRNETKKF